MENIIKDIISERKSQDKKWGRQNHTPMVWLPILMEEVGEVAKAALEPHFKSKGYTQYKNGSYDEYREELIQVAAVCVAMLESLERNK